ncbi:MAG: dioxygenase [Gammaproteobacteria bacterium]|nr:dioxygenase [Gammaproteobacteria bacterium]NIR85268.1 dioxygenase [Gammaproteobacteria bacterium]NIR88384.1 dioxygenase [Gammaproteobacteria bacterium]NIU06334.1 dioxygenase [Gammaproteobacteria bacterium]NIV53233.1 dioxygenase [Gammaproteobacteria bacterium]
MPVAFVAHGAPTLASDATKGAQLSAWAASMPKPRAILVASAHWQQSPPCLGTQRTRELIYDFYGFPEALYRLRYPAPGSPELAAEVKGLLDEQGMAWSEEPARGLDHGVWVPLLHMWPDADVPVLQISQPATTAAGEFFALGCALAPLRERGVLILGSGNLTHNLRRLDWQGRASPPEWARAFDDWCRRTLTEFDADALLAYRTRAPQAGEAHPTDEHFTPLLIAAGAASTHRRSVLFPVEGFEYGSLSRRCVQFN